MCTSLQKTENPFDEERPRASHGEFLRPFSRSCVEELAVILEDFAHSKIERAFWELEWCCRERRKDRLRQRKGGQEAGVGERSGGERTGARREGVERTIIGASSVNHEAGLDEKKNH